LGVGDGEDRRHEGGHDGFRERMEGILLFFILEREIIYEELRS